MASEPFRRNRARGPRDGIPRDSALRLVCLKGFAMHVRGRGRGGRAQSSRRETGNPSGTPSKLSPEGVPSSLRGRGANRARRGVIFCSFISGVLKLLFVLWLL